MPLLKDPCNPLHPFPNFLNFPISCKIMLMVAVGLFQFRSGIQAQNMGIGTSSPMSTLEVNGSIGEKITTITSNATLTSTDAVIICNSASNITVTIPSATSISGRIYSLKNINTGVVTIALSGGQLIDGLSNKLLGTNAEVSIINNGSNWYILSEVKDNPKPGTFLFATDQSVGNNDFLGVGTSSSTFIRNSIVVPISGELTSITFSIRNQVLNTNITAAVWVNNVSTSLSANIADGFVNIWATGNGSVFVLQGDLISVRMNWTGGPISSGVSASITYR